MITKPAYQLKPKPSHHPAGGRQSNNIIYQYLIEMAIKCPETQMMDQIEMQLLFLIF